MTGRSDLEAVARVLAACHRDLVEIGSPLPAAEGDVVVCAASIIDHVKRVLIGQDPPYRAEKAFIVLSEASRLLSLVSPDTCDCTEHELAEGHQAGCPLRGES